MDLLMDAGHGLPTDFADLDKLTPFGTLFRYEDLPSEVTLDRALLLALINSLHEFVSKKLS